MCAQILLFEDLGEYRVNRPHAGQLLPCHNEERVTGQVAPTIELLTDMPTMHPEVLQQHGIQPLDYHEGLVFRSAIESIRGSYIASSTVSRQLLIREVLEGLKR